MVDINKMKKDKNFISSIANLLNGNHKAMEIKNAIEENRELIAIQIETLLSDMLRDNPGLRHLNDDEINALARKRSQLAVSLHQILPNPNWNIVKRDKDIILVYR